VLFHEAMEKFSTYELEESFARFERAAGKGHDESIWILSVWKDVEMERNALEEAFAETEEPLGWYFAARFEDFEPGAIFDQMSAEGGCIWGQIRYGQCFKDGVSVEEDEEVYLEWLQKAAIQNNPEAMHLLGEWFRNEGNDKEKALSFYRAAAKLGWKSSMECLARMLRSGRGCVKDLRQAAIWSAIGNTDRGFGERASWGLLRQAKWDLRGGSRQKLDYDFDQLCYALGWGLYWYQYKEDDDDQSHDLLKDFAKRCLNYYCSCVELQQESIFTFLLFWIRTTGVKEPGKIIGKMVWEQRKENLIPSLEHGERQGPNSKRIKN
jgi:hypothetical protein